MREKIEAYIRDWENKCYYNGIPDDAPNEIFDKVPSYRKICIAILKNDLRPLGFTPKQSKYYGMFKRIELEQRKGYLKQLKLF